MKNQFKKLPKLKKHKKISHVFKIFFDRTDSLRQWGVLLGDEKPGRSPMNFPVLRLKSRKVQKKLEAENDIKPPKI